MSRSSASLPGFSSEELCFRICVPKCPKFLFLMDWACLWWAQHGTVEMVNCVWHLQRLNLVFLPSSELRLCVSICEGDRISCHLAGAYRCLPFSALNERAGGPRKWMVINVSQWQPGVHLSTTAHWGLCQQNKQAACWREGLKNCASNKSHGVANSQWTKG